MSHKFDERKYQNFRKYKKIQFKRMKTRIKNRSEKIIEWHNSKITITKFLMDFLFTCIQNSFTFLGYLTAFDLICLLFQCRENVMDEMLWLLHMSTKSSRCMWSVKKGFFFIHSFFLLCYLNENIMLLMVFQVFALKRAIIFSIFFC